MSVSSVGGEVGSLSESESEVTSQLSAMVAIKFQDTMRSDGVSVSTDALFA